MMISGVQAENRSDVNIIDLKTPAQDTLNELLKRGAQQRLAKAAETLDETALWDSLKLRK